MNAFQLLHLQFSLSYTRSTGVEQVHYTSQELDKRSLHPHLSFLFTPSPTLALCWHIPSGGKAWWRASFPPRYSLYMGQLSTCMSVLISQMAWYSFSRRAQVSQAVCSHHSATCGQPLTIRPLSPWSIDWVSHFIHLLVLDTLWFLCQCFFCLLKQVVLKTLCFAYKRASPKEDIQLASDYKFHYMSTARFTVCLQKDPKCLNNPSFAMKYNGRLLEFFLAYLTQACFLLKEVIKGKSIFSFSLVKHLCSHLKILHQSPPL